MDWPGWTLTVLIAVFVCWLLFRWLAALAFRHLLLGGILRQYGWQADLPDNSAARGEFDQRVRQQRAENWAHIREQGWQGMKDVSRNAKLRPAASPWRADVSITGMYRGRTFLASQNRRYEWGSTGGQSSGASTRRRALVELHALPASAFGTGVALPRFDVRTGLLTGKARGAPPGLEQLLGSRRFRVLRCDGATLFATLGPRISRGRLLGGLEFLSAIADRIGPPPGPPGPPPGTPQGPPPRR
jgi:hypothetical protein